MQKYDVVIVGGGVIGTSIAYFLSKSGIKVVLLEKGSVSEGSSSKCDGNLQVGDSASGNDTEFVMKSLALFKDVSEDMDIDIQWKNTDSLFVFETEEEIEVGRKLVERKNNDGCSMQILDKKEIHDLEPNLAEDLVGGIITYKDGMVNPILMCIGLAGRAARYGADIKTHTKVCAISKTNGTFKIETDSGTYISEKVINAAGIWAPEIGKMVGLDIPIIPRQGQILVIEEAKGFIGRTITEFAYIMTKQESKDYVRKATPEMERFGIAALVEPTEEGTLLVGSSRQFIGFDLRNDDRVIKAMAQRICRFLPEMAQMNIIRTYAGLRPYVADHRPIISDTPIDGYYIAAGHEGGGITLGLQTGKVMEELINGKELSMDLSPFSYGRFEPN